MSSDPFRPPLPTLAGALVLEYAILDGRVTYSGHSNLFVDGNEIGPAARVAIGQELNEAHVLLFHCDSDWVVLGVAEYPSLRRQRYELKGSTEAFQSVGSVLLKLSSRQQKMRQIQCIAFFVGKGLPK